jgi:tetratricopeptide (TPR) repeat protein
MNSYDAHFDDAERLRINGNTVHDFREAIEHYQAYLDLGGSKLVEANQLMGVCYQRLHEYENAIACFLIANEDSSFYQSGNIERDLAESYGAMRNFSAAKVALDNSLDMFPYDKYPEEHATSLGFLARLQQRQGQLSESVVTFADADTKLHAGNNRHTELYNKLAYASALSRNGQLLKSRRVVFEALRLSISKDSVTGRRYGSRQHHIRALALISCGHRLEDYLKARKAK